MNETAQEVVLRGSELLLAVDRTRYLQEAMLTFTTGEELPPYEAWYNAIDLDTFNIQDADTCILGQLYGEYLNGIDHLREFVLSQRPRNYFYIGVVNSGEYWRLGFTTNEPELHAGDVQRAWVQIIQTQRNVHGNALRVVHEQQENQ